MSALFPPLLVQVALTFVILSLLGIWRLKGAQRPEVKAAIARGESADFGRTTDLLSDNLKNQFECPVLFYTGILTAAVASISSPTLIGLAWFFVVTRIIHAVIHVTVNVVRLRFITFLIGALALMVFWIVLGIELLGG